MASSGVPVLTPVSDASQLAGYDALVVVATSFTDALPSVLGSFAQTLALAQKVHHLPRLILWLQRIGLSTKLISKPVLRRLIVKWARR